MVTSSFVTAPELSVGETTDIPWGEQCDGGNMLVAVLVERQ